MKVIEGYREGRELRRAVRRGTQLLPASGTADDFVEALARRRSREVRILETNLGGNSPSGAWIPTSQRDYFLVPAGASPTRRRAVLCHEAAHVLLGHDPALHASLTPALLQALAPTLQLTTSSRLIQRTGYSDRQEAAAERVATLLAASFDDHARAREWGRSSTLSARLR